tara:strand:- start:5678 stop:7078 length:1401 start_codon:yes stop_codon:yes gene_type:complete
MKLINFSTNIKKTLNFLIFLFPGTFIIGNAAVNINLLLISAIGILFYKKEVFKLDKNLTTICVVTFFVYVVIATILNHLTSSSNNNILKSIIYLRYLIFLLVLSCMVKKNDLNFKYFIFSCLLFSSIVSLTVLHEEITGQNLLGYRTHPYHNPGIFGNELVSGGYIQKFACLGIFFAPFVLTKKNKMLFFCLLVLVMFFSLSIFVSGNRTPLLLFGLFLSLGILLVKHMRLPFILGSILSLLIFVSIINTQQNYKEYWRSFYQNVNKLVVPGSKYFIFSEVKKDYSEIKNKTDPKDRTPGLEEGKFDYGFWKRKNWEGFKPTTFGSGHRIIWVTAIETWLDNPIIGNGIKSFREKCKSKLDTPNRVCENHTHHYYLEILNDTGLIGVFLIIFPIYILLITRFKKNYTMGRLNKQNSFIFYSIFLSLVIEFFPFRSSGNFFSTYNSALIFLLIGLFLNYQISSKTKS